MNFQTICIFLAIIGAAFAEPEPEPNSYLGEFGRNNFGISGKVYQQDESTLLIENFQYSGNI